MNRKIDGRLASPSYTSFSSIYNHVLIQTRAFEERETYRFAVIDQIEQISQMIIDDS